MTDTIKSAVMERLRQIKGPDLEGDIVSLGLVSDVFVSDGRVVFPSPSPQNAHRSLSPCARLLKRWSRKWMASKP